MTISINISHAKTKVHCRYTPRFEKGKPPRRFLKRVNGLLECHRWSRNSAINAMRKQGYSIKVPGRYSETVIMPRARKMRHERESLMKEVAKCMVYFANLDPFSPALFEVECSISAIARFVGVYHEYPPGYDDANNLHGEGQYRHGRISYCRLLRCLNDMEQAGLIVVAREYDKHQAQYKASRVFLGPLFFKTIGMSLKEVGEYLVSEEKRLRKKGLAQNYQKRIEKQERLLVSGLVASIDRISLKNLLSNFRDQFFNEAGVRPTLKNTDKYDPIPRSLKSELKASPKAAYVDDIYKLKMRFSDLCEKAGETQVGVAYLIQKWNPTLSPHSVEFYQMAISELRRRLGVLTN